MITDNWLLSLIKTASELWWMSGG